MKIEELNQAVRVLAFYSGKTLEEAKEAIEDTVRGNHDRIIGFGVIVNTDVPSKFPLYHYRHTKGLQSFPLFIREIAKETLPIPPTLAYHFNSHIRDIYDAKIIFSPTLLELTGLETP